MSKSPMRRHARLSFAEPLRVIWKDTRGQIRALRANCVDLSPEGARLETDAPIAPRTSITLDSARYGNMGRASVRHCARHGVKYTVGVEFTASLALAEPGRKRCWEEIQPSARERA